MLKKMLLGTVIAVLCATGVDAQDLVGDWQGTLKIPQRPELRLLFHIAKAEDGGWNASMFSIDQTPDWGAGIPANSVSVDRLVIKLIIDAIRGVYDGKLSE